MQEGLASNAADRAAAKDLPGMLVVALTPILALIGVLAAIAVVMWYLGRYPTEMLMATTALSGPAVLVAALLLYRQTHAGKAARASLSSAEARVADIVESAMDPVIAIDEDQRVILFNAAAEQIFRWPRSAVIGQPIDMLIPARYHESHRRHVAQFGRTGVTSRRMGVNQVLKAVRANGEEFAIEASISQHEEAGHKVMTVILRDVTARLAAETQRATSEARLRGILESAMDAIITIDETQRIVLFNRAAEQMFGCPAAEAIGAPLTWFLPERYRSAHTEQVRKFGSTGVSSRRMGGTRIVMGLRRNGGEFPIDATISQLAEGGVKYYTVILRDVSERQAAEEALRQSRNELKELASAAASAREEEKTRIARELHDELAQALTALKMELSLIPVTTPNAGEDLLARLAKMGRQIDRTIAAMRRIAADLRPLTLDDLGLVPAIESACTEFTERTGVACELAIGAPEFDLTDAQATAVFRIVQESLTNIAKHARAKQVEVAIDAEGDELVVNVSDDGIGFATDAPRKPSSYGLLGLRERAYLLSGRARIESAPGQGTQIEVRLPLHPEGKA